MPATIWNNQRPCRLKDEDCLIPILELADLECDLFQGQRTGLGYTTIEPAIRLSLINMRSPDQEVSMLAFSSFRVCMRVMEKLQQIYSSPEMSTSYIHNSLRNVYTLGAHVSSVKEILEMNKHDYSDLVTVLSHSAPAMPWNPLCSSSSHFPQLPADQYASAAQGDRGGEGMPMLLGDIFADVGFMADQMPKYFQPAVSPNNGYGCSSTVPFKDAPWSVEAWLELFKETLSPTQ